MNSGTSTRVAWHKGPMAGFDLETTGVDVEQDRIVTASLVWIFPPASDSERARTIEQTTIVNPGVPIPPGATAVHGITDERAAAEGQDPEAVLQSLVTELGHIIQAGTPIVGMNLVYDLTLLDRECRRWGVPALDRIEPVVDVRVLDKHVSWRRGPRKLQDLCSFWGVKLDQAHHSGADALASLRLAFVLAERHPQFQIPLAELHARQIGWHAEQVASFAGYRRRIGDPLTDEDGSWPVRPCRNPVDWPPVAAVPGGEA